MTQHKPLTRVPVPLEMRTAVLQLGTRQQACLALGISPATWDDVVDPHATLRPKMLAKLEQALRIRAAS